MSKIGRKPVTVKEGVTVTIEKQNVTVQGSKGTLSFSVPHPIAVAIKNGIVTVSQKNDKEDNTALFGLTRAIIANMVKGVSEGFARKLELSGVGYRAQVVGRDLSLSVGFSHPVIMKAPEGITFAVAENVITVNGSDTVLVGDIASKIRAIRPPEPYKGKGIKYVGERVRRKAGKAAKAVGAK